ncbi:MAG: SCO family protein [Planctomycetes bacterium]|nr:SCO family protein [Planctomycetota bacterium]
MSTLRDLRPSKAALRSLLSATILSLAAACGGEPVTQAASPLSIYQLEHTFTDQGGAARKLGDSRGHPVLIAMIFTHCSYACPAIVADVQRVVAAAGDPPDLRVLLVSMDHKRDLPATLAAFAAEHGLPPDRFSLLHGEADAVAEVAAVLGVRYAEVEGGDFSHSNRITLLDRDGVIVHRHDGLGEDLASLVAAVKGQESR